MGQTNRAAATEAHPAKLIISPISLVVAKLYAIPLIVPAARIISASHIEELERLPYKGKFTYVFGFVDLLMNAGGTLQRVLHLHPTRALNEPRGAHHTADSCGTSAATLSPSHCAQDEAGKPLLDLLPSPRSTEEKGPFRSKVPISSRDMASNSSFLFIVP